MSKAIDLIRPPELTREQLYQRQRDYEREVRHLVAMFVDIENRSIHGIRLYPDGSRDRVESYHPDDFLMRHQIRQQMKAIANFFQNAEGLGQ